MLRKGNNSRSRINIDISFDKDNILCNYIDIEITFKYSGAGSDLKCDVVGGYNYHNTSSYASYSWRRINTFSRFYCIFNSMNEKTLSFGNIPYTSSNKKIIRVIGRHTKTTDSLNMNRQYYLFSFYSIENQVIDAQIVNRGYDSKYNSYTAPINNNYSDVWIKTSKLNLIKLCQFNDAKNSYYINTDWIYIETVNNKVYYLQYINSEQLEGIDPNTHTLWIDQNFNLYVGIAYTNNYYKFYTNPTKYTSTMQYDTVYNMIGHKCLYLKKNLNFLSVKHLLNNFNYKEVA